MMDCTGTCHRSPNNYIGKRSNKTTDFSVVWKVKGYTLLNSQNIQINSARPILVMNAKLQRCCHGHGHEYHAMIQGLHMHDASGCKTDMQSEYEEH